MDDLAAVRRDRGLLMQFIIRYVSIVTSISGGVNLKADRVEFLYDKLSEKFYSDSSSYKFTTAYGTTGANLLLPRLAASKFGKEKGQKRKQKYESGMTNIFAFLMLKLKLRWFKKILVFEMFLENLKKHKLY